MKPGIFRLALLFIAGTTRPWYLYLVGTLLGAVILVPWMGRRTGDLAIAIAGLCNAVVWLVTTVGMLATVRQLRELRPPNVYRKASLVLGLAALFTLILPTALLVMFGDAAMQLGTTRHVFMTLALWAATGMLIATLPFSLVCAGMIVGPLAFVGFHNPETQLTQTVFWQSAWRIEAITLLALIIVAWRCRALIRSETTAGLLWSSLAQMRVTMSNLFVAAGQYPDAAYRMFPASDWMMPSWRTRAGASLWTRISTLMGPPFAPGNLRQQLPVLAVIVGIGALFLWFFVERFVERLPAHVQRMFLDTMVALIPVMFITILSSITRTFAGRLRMLHRPQSADLAELALLPGLEDARTPLANYCAVIFGRPLREFAVIAAVLGGIAVMVAHFKTWSLLLLVLMIAGFTVVEIARYLAVGRPYIQSIIFEALASGAVLLPMSALAFVSARPPFVSLHTSNAVSHVVIPAMVVIVWLAAIHSVRRAYATAQQLPHPFLDADERHVMTVS